MNKMLGNLGPYQNNVMGEWLKYKIGHKLSMEDMYTMAHLNIGFFILSCFLCLLFLLKVWKV